MILPYGPDNRINLEQIEREYEWVRNTDRTYGRSLFEWLEDAWD